jgi:hypothetical protein
VSEITNFEEKKKSVFIEFPFICLSNLNLFLRAENIIFCCSSVSAAPGGHKTFPLLAAKPPAALFVFITVWCMLPQARI